MPRKRKSVDLQPLVPEVEYHGAGVKRRKGGLPPKSLFAMFNQEDGFTDIVLEIGPGRKRFRAHRVVLACCQYYERLFSSAWKESEAGLVRHPKMSSDAFEVLMQYLYTSSFPNSLELSVLLELLEIGQQLCLDKSFFVMWENHMQWGDEDNTNRFLQIWSVLHKYPGEHGHNRCVDWAVSLYERDPGRLLACDRGMLIALITHQHFWLSRKDVRTLLKQWCSNHQESQSMTNFSTLKSLLPRAGSRSPLNLIRGMGSSSSLLSVTDAESIAQQILQAHSRESRESNLVSKSSVRLTFIAEVHSTPHNENVNDYDAYRYALYNFITNNKSIFQSPDTLMVFSTKESTKLCAVYAGQPWCESEQKQYTPCSFIQCLHSDGRDNTPVINIGALRLKHGTNVNGTEMLAYGAYCGRWIPRVDVCNMILDVSKSLTYQEEDALDENGSESDDQEILTGYQLQLYKVALRLA
eukprot:GILJ01014724.1.p1 GENE.GILJ01014724.1~~GILJ01014724.1.p1  ORF type:complete len:467 (+),score=31.52 GILJ01014724.1:92-1492(+)